MPRIFKHLTRTDRLRIEKCLNEGTPTVKLQMFCACISALYTEKLNAAHTRA